MSYTLYKQPISLDTLAMVQYLYSQNIVLLPKKIIERNYPTSITELPSIDDGTLHIGLQSVINWYENQSNQSNLYSKALLWKSQNKDFRINV